MNNFNLKPTNERFSKLSLNELRELVDENYRLRKAYNLRILNSYLHQANNFDVKVCFICGKLL